ncbi:unnamed protein product [Linum tenue]|uniref:Uncharacterized protein n=1 Tax=Linum tenue TaxID=586396 RepID=A0AAV0GYF7_9ROSI|nr:unnamed protein product [Linum tenue]
MYQWRKFDFFEDKYGGKSSIPDEISGKIECSSSGRGKVVIGCNDGTVSFLDRGLNFNSGFQSHSSSVLFLQQLKQRNFLLTVGEDEQLASHQSAMCLKVFDLDKPSQQQEGTSSAAATPDSIGILRIFTNNFPEAKITSFLVLEEAPPILLIAIGLDNGCIYCIKGDIARERIQRFKLQVDNASNKSQLPVTGLGFRVDGQTLQLFAVTPDSSQQADAAATAEVLRKYGDHLYSKQDYDEAMAQYINTIGHLEPSYVIQKFLDAQRIHNLTNYLENLHEKGLASKDHTTLLLNCYTKLKDVEKLNAGDHEWYLKILLEDLGRYDEALEYISSLDSSQAGVTVKEYGRHSGDEKEIQDLRTNARSSSSASVLLALSPLIFQRSISCACTLSINVALGIMRKNARNVLPTTDQSLRMKRTWSRTPKIRTVSSNRLRAQKMGFL